MSILVPQHDGAYPTLAKGQGARVYDVEGRPYIDFDNMKGSVLLGHADPAVGEAVAAALHGTCGVATAPSSKVYSVAGLLADCIGKTAVAFYRSGTSAVYAAVHALQAWRNRPL